MIAKLLSSVRKALPELDAGIGRTARLQGDYREGVKDLLDTATGKMSADQAHPIKAAVNEAVSTGLESGTQYSNTAIEQMIRNVKESGTVNAGLSMAGQTQSSVAAFQSLSNDSMMGIGVGALLGAGAANISGGDAGEGAAIGAGMVLGGRAFAKTFQEYMPELEQSIMKKALGSDYTDKAKLVMGGPNGSSVYTSARQKNLEALKTADKTGLNKFEQYVAGVMTDPKQASIGVQSRTAIASGALLGGVAFTSSTRDKSSGFNKNRGNRF